MTPGDPDHIEQLLNDADSAANGANFAASIGHSEPAKALHAKAARLLAKAEALDPKHTAPAWQQRK